VRKLLLFLLLMIDLYAKGTSAGTVINNIATLDFVVDNQQQQIESNVASDTVAQLIDLHIDSLDTKDITIKKGEDLLPLSFQITNTGNGNDNIELSYMIDQKSDFQINEMILYIDSNHNKQFDTEDQTAQKLSLEADESRVFFLTSKAIIEPKVSKRHNKCIVTVKGRSTIGGSGERGKVHKDKGVKGVDAVDGEDGGIVETVGVWDYESSKLLFIKQTSTVKNRFGNSEPISGAIITYLVDISTPNSVTAKNVIYKNPIPKNTQYKKGSMHLNGKKLSDCKDSDQGLYDSKNNLIKVDIGCVAAGDKQQIQFKVKIK
jgi:uncharacterized repeat protein (TIGR01451 family)